MWVRVPNQNSSTKLSDCLSFSPCPVPLDSTVPYAHFAWRVICCGSLVRRGLLVARPRYLAARASGTLAGLFMCDLRRVAATTPSTADRLACCSALVLDDACATSLLALPHEANGTGRIDKLRSWCYTSTRDRLHKESAKWKDILQAKPQREYRERRRGRPMRARTSQQSFFHEWMGCFGCEDPSDPQSCCSRRGDCVFGICACNDGTFGVDCASSHALGTRPIDANSIQPTRLPSTPGAAAIHSTVPRSAGRSLRIYVYETLPLDLGAFSFSLRTWISNLRGGFEVYSTEWRFLNYLLRDWAVRTLDPESADLYLVPTLGSLGRMPGSEGTHRCMQPAQLEMLVHHLRSRHPYWDRSEGRDHVFFLTGDQGACGLGTTGTRPIFITAWGLLGTSKKMAAFDTFKDDFVEPSAIRRALEAGEWCHAPHKDVVVPPYGDVQFTSTPPPDMPLASSERRAPFEHTLLHVGGIWGAGNHGTRKISFYSQGMRQALYLLFGDERGAKHGMWIQNRSMQSAQLARKTKRSKFCLSPSGHGWGMRTGKNAVLGCVPLIAQPYVVQPYEMLLPYEHFSRRIAYEDVPRVPEIVNASDEEVYLMRQKLARVRRAFVWRVEGGGLAYNHTLLHLCQRAMELRGALRAGPGTDCAPLAAGLRDASPTQRMPAWLPPPLVAVSLELQAERRAAMKRLGRERPGRAVPVGGG